MKKGCTNIIMALLLCMMPVAVTAKEAGRKVLYIKVTDASSHECIPGAAVEIRDGDDLVMSSFISGREAYMAEGLEDGRYTIRVLGVPEGYQPKGPAEILFGEGYELNSQSVMEVELYSNELRAAAFDALNNTFVGGAGFLIYDAAGNEAARFVTEKNEYTSIKGLLPGDYQIRPASIPKGFMTADVFPLTIPEGGPLEPIEIRLDRMADENTLQEEGKDEPDKGGESGKEEKSNNKNGASGEKNLSYRQDAPDNGKDAAMPTGGKTGIKGKTAKTGDSGQGFMMFASVALLAFLAGIAALWRKKAVASRALHSRVTYENDRFRGGEGDEGRKDKGRSG